MSAKYESPSRDTSAAADTEVIEPGPALTFFLVLSTFLACFVTLLHKFIVFGSLGGVSGSLGGAVGGVLAPLIFGGVILCLFQSCKRYRNTRSRFKVFIWSQVIFIVYACFLVIIDKVDVVNL